MPNKAILCYIYSWSHGSLYVYSLVGGLVPGRTRDTGWKEGREGKGEEERKKHKLYRIIL